jgi:hypothetical protein
VLKTTFLRKNYVVDVFLKDSAVSLEPRKPIISNDILELLGKYEAIFETTFAHESGPDGG